MNSLPGHCAFCLGVRIAKFLARWVQQQVCCHWWQLNRLSFVVECFVAVIGSSACTANHCSAGDSRLVVVAWKTDKTTVEMLIKTWLIEMKPSLAERLTRSGEAIVRSLKASVGPLCDVQLNALIRRWESKEQGVSDANVPDATGSAAGTGQRKGHFRMHHSRSLREFLAWRFNTTTVWFT